jgi:WD40 repeat protein
MSACFSPDARHVVSASWDHWIKVWDRESGSVVLNVESFHGSFSCAVFTPDGRRIVAGCSDNAVHVLPFEPGPATR